MTDSPRTHHFFFTNQTLTEVDMDPRDFELIKFFLAIIVGLVGVWCTAWIIALGTALVQWRSQRTDGLIALYKEIIDLQRIARWAPLLPGRFKRYGRYKAIRALRKLHHLSRREFPRLVERYDPCSPTKRRYRLILE